MAPNLCLVHAPFKRQQLARLRATLQLHAEADFQATHHQKGAIFSSCSTPFGHLFVALALMLSLHLFDFKSALISINDMLHGVVHVVQCARLYPVFS